MQIIEVLQQKRLVGQRLSRIRRRQMYQTSEWFPPLFSSRMRRRRILRLKEEPGKKRLNKDGHLITEDSVLPTTAPGGAPEQNRCYQTPAYFIRSPPCAHFARALGAPRTAHFATPPLGAGAFVIAVVDFFRLGLRGKESR